MEKAQGLEARARRSDLEVDEHRLAELYDERVPDEVVSSRTFERWWSGATRAGRDSLAFTVDDLLGVDSGSIDTDGFPLTWSPNDGAVVICSRMRPRESSAPTTLLAAPPRSEPGSGSTLPSARCAAAERMIT
jgi:ATP-dependent helicase HrpA